MSKKLLTSLAATATLAVPFSAVGLSSQASASPTRSADAASAGGYTFGIVLPDVFVPRYVTQDYPYFKAEIAKFCKTCKVLFKDAANSVSSEETDAEALVADHVKVLVLDPVDGATAGSMVRDAVAHHIPVISYDRLITSKQLSYAVSNNYTTAGKLQAESLVHKLKAEHAPKAGGHGIVALYGADTDPNARAMKAGGLPIIKASGYKILASNMSWDPTTQGDFMAEQITRFGTKVVGVWSGNDGNAGAAIGALKGTEDAFSPWPVITGLDASIPGVQSILDGLQYETTYNNFRHEAVHAAIAAYDLAVGKPVPASPVHVEGVPEYLNPPQAVTFGNINKDLIQSGFYKPSQICTGLYVHECKAAGIKV
ncbi:MAG: substrate-binding domain-containing protein [Acidimicrobiales bacterium]